MKFDNEVRKNILNWIVILGFIIMVAFCCGFIEDKQENYQLVEVIYVVREDDTLWNIAEKYMAKNSYGKRDIREFIQGIIELNVEQYPEVKYGYISKGQELRINYFTVKEK